VTHFADPAYASYISLCRELRLRRKFEEGDYVWVDLEAPGAVGVTIVSARDVEGGKPPSGMGFRWLPRLDQWIRLLWLAGQDSITFEPTVDGGVRCSGSTGYRRFGRTDEEAAARLWCDVTGRPSEIVNP
jgi:hypothetical protein